jgi:hypothetical protein
VEYDAKSLCSPPLIPFLSTPTGLSDVRVSRSGLTSMRPSTPTVCVALRRTQTQCTSLVAEFGTPSAKPQPSTTPEVYYSTTVMTFSSVLASIPAQPSSRPLPLVFIPPQGSAGSRAAQPFTHTAPART